MADEKWIFIDPSQKRRDYHSSKVGSYWSQTQRIATPQDASIGAVFGMVYPLKVNPFRW